MDSKFFLVTMLVLIFISATPVYAQPPLAEDWVSDALGYLNSFELYDYYSDINPNNRYQVSLALANTLQSLEIRDNNRIQRFGVSRDVNLSNIVQQYNLSVTEEEQLPERYLITLTALANEYQDELDVLGYKIKSETQIISIDSINGGGASDNKKSGSRFFPETTLDREYLLSANLLPIWSDFYLGAGFILEDDLDNDNIQNQISTEKQPLGYAGLVGEYLLNDEILLEGQYLHNLSDPFETGILQLGARFRFGSVELGGHIKTPENSGERLGLTSFDFSYGDSQSVSLNAGYEVDTNFKTIAELANPARTRIDLGIPIPQGRLTLGVSQNWNLDRTGSDELEEIGDGDTSNNISDETDDGSIASLGFIYALTNEASIQLNYSLIDFSDIDTRAEFSIRF